MKVLLVNKFHYRKGGAETYYFDLAEGLEELGHEVVFFSTKSRENEACAQDIFFAPERDYEGKSGLMKKIRDGMSAIYSTEARDRFNRLLEKERPDIIHLNLVQRQLTFSIMDAPLLREKPVVYTAHDYGLICPDYLMLDGNGQICDACMHGKYGNCVARKCIKRSTIKSVLAALESKVASRRGAHKRIDRIIAPSQFMKEKLIEGGLPSKKITVLHNFVNPTPLLHDTTQQYQTKTNPYFLFFGRLSREKGVDVLIEAYLSILENLPRPIKLMIVGDGPSRKSLEELVEAKQAHHNVCFAGFQTGEVLRRYVSNACFTVVCSRCYENYPYSVVESFSLNTPVIGSRIGGIPELVVEGDTGFLCDHGDSDDLGRAMLKAVSISNREYANMRNRCNRYVAEECSKEAHFSSLIRIYESAIDTYGDK